MSSVSNSPKSFPNPLNSLGTAIKNNPKKTAAIAVTLGLTAAAVYNRDAITTFVKPYLDEAVKQTVIHIHSATNQSAKWLNQSYDYLQATGEQLAEQANTAKEQTVVHFNNAVNQGSEFLNAAKNQTVVHFNNAVDQGAEFLNKSSDYLQATGEQLTEQTAQLAQTAKEYTNAMGEQASHTYTYVKDACSHIFTLNTKLNFNDAPVERNLFTTCPLEETNTSSIFEAPNLVESTKINLEIPLNLNTTCPLEAPGTSSMFKAPLNTTFAHTSAVPLTPFEQAKINLEKGFTEIKTSINSAKEVVTPYFNQFLTAVQSTSAKALKLARNTSHRAFEGVKNFGGPEMSTDMKCSILWNQPILNFNEKRFVMKNC